MQAKFFRSGLLAAVICASLVGAARDSFAQPWPSA